MSSPRAAVVMGSLSDVDVMREAVGVLLAYEIEVEVRVLSAHRDPEAVADFARSAAERGLGVLIAGAGGAAHLAGALAAHSRLPIIGVPLVASDLAGLDSLLATVQMPGGVPVGTMGVGKSGAVNAGHLAARILALDDPDLASRVDENRQQQVAKVRSMDDELPARLADD